MSKIDHSFGLDLSRVRVLATYFGHMYHADVLAIRQKSVDVQFRLKSGRVVQKTLAITPTKSGNSRGHTRILLARSSMDYVTTKLTSFPSFRDLLEAKGGYRPTIMQDGAWAILANTYDDAQFQRKDERRAYCRSA